MTEQGLFLFPTALTDFAEMSLGWTLANVGEKEDENGAGYYWNRLTSTGGAIDYHQDALAAVLVYEVKASWANHRYDLSRILRTIAEAEEKADAINTEVIFIALGCLAKTRLPDFQKWANPLFQLFVRMHTQLSEGAKACAASLLWRLWHSAESCYGTWEDEGSDFEREIAYNPDKVTQHLSEIEKAQALVWDRVHHDGESLETAQLKVFTRYLRDAWEKLIRVSESIETQISDRKIVLIHKVWGNARITGKPQMVEAARVEIYPQAGRVFVDDSVGLFGQAGVTVTASYKEFAGMRVGVDGKKLVAKILE